MRDDKTRDRVRLLFLPNYSVTLAELVIPAADLHLAGLAIHGLRNQVDKVLKGLTLHP